MITFHNKQGVTPSKVKKSYFKTPEKQSGHVSFDTDFTTEQHSTINSYSSEEMPKLVNFALGALDERTIDTNEYKCMSISRNQLGNVRQCKYCNMIFDTLDNLQDHTINHFDTKLSSIFPNKKTRCCPSCGKQFQSHKSLKRHYAFQHYCTAEDLNGLLMWGEVGKVMLYFPKSKVN